MTRTPALTGALCAVDDRIGVLERDPIVSGGVARNTTGTLKPGCSSSGRLYRCVTREYVYEQPLTDRSQQNCFERSPTAMHRAA